mmetsp:Transcript_503/g.1701  ORF Transcript_503/g.1701 Transcript_503/m.1701 type:complete len:209 (-) Transcript_503:11-637(-)
MGFGPPGGQVGVKTTGVPLRWRCIRQSDVVVVAVAVVVGGAVTADVLLRLAAAAMLAAESRDCSSVRPQGPGTESGLRTATPAAAAPLAPRADCFGLAFFEAALREAWLLPIVLRTISSAMALMVSESHMEEVPLILASRARASSVGSMATWLPATPVFDAVPETALPKLSAERRSEAAPTRPVAKSTALSTSAVMVDNCARFGPIST